jgi:hypothetical protein
MLFRKRERENRDRRGDPEGASKGGDGGIGALSKTVRVRRTM